MVQEHLLEVLPLDVHKLADDEAPEVGELDHVVPPDVVGEGVVGKVVPAGRDGPEPLFVPHHGPGEDEARAVVARLPRGLAELVQLARLAQQSPLSLPTLYLPARHVQLLGEPVK